MKKTFTLLFTLLLLIGCGSNAADKGVKETKLVVNKSLADLKLNDQNGQPQTINADTKKVVFVFSKENGHACNDFFASKEATYLKENKTQFVADVSAAPSLIRSMFIIPGLKDFNHTILVIDNKIASSSYKTQENSEKIVLVLVENQTITEIKYISDVQTLEKELKL